MAVGDALCVLVVDDDAALLHATASLLARQGWTIVTARDGLEAREKLKSATFDVIVSDVNMPGYGGLEFLRAVRERDLDVPVILVTGTPTIEASSRAVEYGAFRYLIKPYPKESLLDAVRKGASMHKLAILKQQATALAGGAEQRLAEPAALEVRFAKSVAQLWMAYQPIVSWSARSVYGNEALLRSDEPQMKNPGDILDAAERLDRIHELGRKVRATVALAAANPEPGRGTLFVNLHSADLSDEQLYAADAPLSKIASQVVLEITERAALHGVSSVTEKIASLKAMGFRIAIDDLGAGYAGLSSFTQLSPDIAKLDMSLIRDIDADLKRQSIVRAMKNLCDELEILVVCEGIETIAERDTLIGLGCDLFQGYLFAKPARSFPQPRWWDDR